MKIFTIDATLYDRGSSYSQYGLLVLLTMCVTSRAVSAGSKQAASPAASSAYCIDTVASLDFISGKLITPKL